MNATTSASAAAMQTAVAAFAAIPVHDSEAATDAFGALIDAGQIRLEHMVALMYRMHNRIVDGHEAVAIRLDREHQLEFIADRHMEAIEAAEIAEQDSEEVAA